MGRCVDAPVGGHRMQPGAGPRDGPASSPGAAAVAVLARGRRGQVPVYEFEPLSLFYFFKKRGCGRRGAGGTGTRTGAWSCPVGVLPLKL